jgi:hypothetical protein
MIKIGQCFKAYDKDPHNGMGESLPRQAAFDRVFTCDHIKTVRAGLMTCAGDYEFSDKKFTFERVGL